MEGGRTVYYEPDRIIIRDPSGQQYVRGNDLYRFRYGARDIRTETIGGETRTVVIRPDGTEVITVVAADGSKLAFDVSAESLHRTTGLDRPGRINLEKALRFSDRLGGHLLNDKTGADVKGF